MLALRPHQEKGSNTIVNYCDNKIKGNFLSVACCVSSGKTLLAIAGMSKVIERRIESSNKTFQVFVCPRLNLCDQQAKEIYDYMKEKNLPVSILLYNSNNTPMENKYKEIGILERNSRFCDDSTELFLGSDHIIVVACDASIWRGKAEEAKINENIFKSILKNNEKFGRENTAIIYDEAHNYESKFDSIERISSFFDVSVLMSGTPGEKQCEIHNKDINSIDYSIRDGIIDNIICRPTLNLINTYDGLDDRYLESAVNSVVTLENTLHKSPFIPRILVCASGIDSIESICRNFPNCNVITYHSDKSVKDTDKNKPDVIESKVIYGISHKEEKKTDKEILSILEKIDESNYFNNSLPIIVFQVDKISEGINIKSFNSIIITSHSDIRQMQQIGRVLRDWHIDNFSKKDNDVVNIYATCKNTEDIRDLILNLEKYDLTDDVFNWGKVLINNNGSRAKDGLPELNKWEQINAVLDIEKILKMCDDSYNKNIIKNSSKIFADFSKDECAQLIAELKVLEKSKKGKSGITSSKTKHTSQHKTQSNNTKKTSLSSKDTDLIRALYKNLLNVTSKKLSRTLWYRSEKDKDIVLNGLNINNTSLIKKFIKAMKWHF